MADVRSSIRAARARRRRKTYLLIALTILAVVGTTFGALLATGALEGSPGTARAQPPDTTTTSTTRAPEEPIGVCRDELTPEAPLRLWIGGDSLAGSLGPALGEQAAATGVVQPVFDTRVSSGVSTPEFFDWPEHVIESLPTHDPEIVVFIIGANDWKAPTESSASAATWRGEYEVQVEELLALLEGTPGSRHVFWVGSPPMQERQKDTGVREVNAVAREVIDRHEHATYVDAYALFAGDDGGYTPELTGPDGKTVRVRAGDGVHLTEAGAELLGTHVFELLDAHCSLTAQAVPGQAKTVMEAEGSDGPAGPDGAPTRSGSSGSSGSGSSPSGTSATTAPPAVEPPPVEPPPGETPPSSDPGGGGGTPPPDGGGGGGGEPSDDGSTGLLPPLA